MWQWVELFFTDQTLHNSPTKLKGGIFNAAASQEIKYTLNEDLTTHLFSRYIQSKVLGSSLMSVTFSRHEFRFA